MKNLLLGAFLLLATTVSADRFKYDVINATKVYAGDYLTKPDGTALLPTVNTKPWLVKSAVSTCVVLGDIAGNTATAVTFDWTVPGDFSGSARLFAVVEPVDSDVTVQLRADVIVQAKTIGNSPTILTTVTNGTASTVMAADTDGELNWLPLENAEFDTLNEGDRRKKINVYVGRFAGTGENLRIYNFYIRYKFRDDEHRIAD